MSSVDFSCSQCIFLSITNIDFNVYSKLWTFPNNSDKQRKHPVSFLLLHALWEHLTDHTTTPWHTHTSATPRHLNAVTSYIARCLLYWNNRQESLCTHFEAEPQTIFGVDFFLQQEHAEDKTERHSIAVVSRSAVWRKEGAWEGKDLGRVDGDVVWHLEADVRMPYSDLAAAWSSGEFLKHSKQDVVIKTCMIQPKNATAVPKIQQCP